MSFDYSEMSSVAEELIREFGATATLTRNLDPVYDPVSGTTVAPAPLEQGCNCCVIDYPIKFIDGTNIRSGDRQVYMSVGEFEPKAGDFLTWGSEELKVVSFKRLAPGGLSVLWELQVRA